ncbi:hypothetical protein X975_21489, partial [Stegodyphus mimosarum]
MPPMKADLSGSMKLCPCDAKTMKSRTGNMRNGTWKASFEIPILSALGENTTDENELFELVKISGSAQMQEYLETDEDLYTEDTNDEIKSFISTVVDDANLYKNCWASSEENEEKDKKSET